MTPPPPTAVIEALRETLAQDKHLESMLEQSLAIARRRAERHLDPALYEALDWPVDLPSYEAYLREFVRWIPQQSGAKAWREKSAHDRQAQEVSDRIAHYFWLVGQNVSDGTTSIVENSGPFREWLTEFARQWGSFLDTPASFNQQILDSFLADAPEYTIGESLVDGRPNAPSGWLTFNQFFARELNGGLRPIADPGSNLTITSAADCSFQHLYGIDGESNIPDTTVKKTDSYGNVRQLLDGSRHADAFAGGTFVHYMLPPSAYHRFHLPVGGSVDEAFVIGGEVVMKVDLADHQFVSSDTTTTGYEFSQTRGVVTIDTAGDAAGDIGVVAVVPVGMSQVASVVLTATGERHMAKGEEFGYFQFGGSDMIILFQAGVDVELDTDPGPRKVGSVLGRIRTTAP